MLIFLTVGFAYYKISSHWHDHAQSSALLQSLLPDSAEAEAALQALRASNQWQMTINTTVLALLLVSTIWALYRSVWLKPLLAARKEQSATLSKWEQSEARYQQMLNDATNLICRFDANFKFEFVNRAFMERFGQHPNDYIGSDALALLNDERKAAFLRQIRSYTPEHDSGTMIFHLAETATGERWQQWHQRAFFDKYGHPTHYLAMGTDITDLKQTEERLREAKQAAESASKAKDQFLAMMSHELRTPMNGIVAGADLLQEHNLKGEAREQLDLIQSSAFGMMTLIDQLLDIAQLEAGRLQLRPEVCRMRDIAQQLQRTFARQAEQHGIGLQIEEVGESNPAIVLDKGRTFQIMANLIGNSLKFTKTGRIQARFSLEAAPTGQHSHQLLAVVTDTGIGIEAQDIQRIFNAFERTEESRFGSYGGTGLGLNICRQLSRAMDGDITVESQPGKGSTFTVKLPVGVSSPTAVHFPTGSRSPLSGTLPPMRVLVVDDNRTNQRVATMLLQRLDCGYAVAQDGLEALSLIEACEFDAVLLDLHMPGLNGLETARAMRDGRAGFHATRCPIAALTASVMETDRKRCRAAGMDHFLPKPLVMPELIKFLKSAAHARDEADKTRPPIPSQARTKAR
ncbi:MAG: ATP-binding protein [Verrucomicrobiota bacterium]